MKFPCEIVVWKVLPAIKARLAKELIQKGLTQREAAAKLDLTEAAISQYIHGKRASDFKINKSMDEELSKVAGEIVESKSNLVMMTQCCSLCREIRSSGHICELHRASSSVPENCNVCSVKEEERA